MSRNLDYNFNDLPQANISRSKFNRNSGVKTTFNAGDIIPIYVDEVLPGDTLSMDMASVIRMTTPIHPTMDNANVDIYFFYVPNRLVWDGWEEFMGENKTSYWTQPTEKFIPQIEFPSGGWKKGSIADYMGIPINVNPTSAVTVSHLPFRAYCKIWNDWFRDENLQQPVNISTGDSTVMGKNGDEEEYDLVTDTQLGALPIKAAKYHDYFTSALPQPQKGDAVILPMGEDVPVYTKAGGAGSGEYGIHGKSETAIRFNNYPGYPKGLGVATRNILDISVGEMGYTDNKDNITLSSNTLKPINLWADLSESTSATINQLRQAFQIQKLLEKDARGGTRYVELLRSHFGVISPDSRLQRPEYLGGYRQPIGIDQVLQTSSTDSTSPQGNTAGFSLTGNHAHLFTKSFVEHGILLGLAVVRQEHTYQQGIDKMFFRKRRYDYYFPVLANIGEQAILNKELYLNGKDVFSNNEAFGYQEAWADYRYKPSKVTGAFRSAYTTTLDSWHYADYYEDQPYLSSEWIVETKDNIDRTLAVQSSLEDQFIADFAFHQTAVRPMPVYSIPGLIDHH